MCGGIRKYLGGKVFEGFYTGGSGVATWYEIAARYGHSVGKALVVNGEVGYKWL